MSDPVPGTDGSVPGTDGSVLGKGGALPEGDTKYRAVEGMFDRLASLGRNAMIDRTEVESGPLLRFELQPGDADDAMVRRDWQRRLAWHLQYRQGRTMADVMRRWQCEKQPA